MKPTLLLAIFLIPVLQACTDDRCRNGVERRNCACYEIYAPVCGSDGITYPNDCYAECEGVCEYTQGECP